MAKTDFSSSSPLAGSFLTGRISLPPSLPSLAWIATLYFYFLQSGKAFCAGVLLVQCAYCACGFCVDRVIG